MHLYSRTFSKHGNFILCREVNAKCNCRDSGTTRYVAAGAEQHPPSPGQSPGIKHLYSVRGTRARDLQQVSNHPPMSGLAVNTN